MIKDRLMEFFNGGYKLGFEDGYNAALKGEENVANTSSDFTEILSKVRKLQRSETSILGRRKYGIAPYRLPREYSILGSKRYGKAALLESIKKELENDEITEISNTDDGSMPFVSFDCSCDCGGDGCDCDCSSGCDCGDGGNCN